MIERINDVEIHCKVCERVYRKEQYTNLKNHIEAKHIDCIKFTCCACGGTFSSRASFRTHCRNFHREFNNVPFEISGVQISTLSSSALKLKSFCSLIYKIIQMKNKQKFHADLKALIWSKILRLGGGEYQCQDCGLKKKGSGLTALKNHVEARHLTGLAEYHCPYCGKICSTNNYLNVHISQHHKSDQ